MAKEISGIGIKKIYYGKPLDKVAVPYVNNNSATGLSPVELKAFLAHKDTKQVKNIHEDNWSYEKTLPSRTYYKNKLTGKNYRSSTDDAGESKISFSIGQYDFETKASFEGGGASETKFSASSQFEPKNMTLIALTEDDCYIIYPKADIVAGGTSTDDAVAISVEATSLEPDIQIESEVWILKSAVDGEPATGGK